MSKVIGFILGTIEVAVGIVSGNPGLIVSGIATIVGSAVQILTGRPNQNLQNDQSIKANVRGTAETHSVVFGKARIGGIVFKVGTYKGSTSEDSNNNLLIAIAHSICHPGGCDGVERVWIDDREIPLAQLTRTISGDVQTTQPGSGPNLGNYTAITHLGTSTQAADSTLVARGLATATDYARGICYSVFNLYRDKNNQDGFLAAFQGHIPLLTVELRGCRCYDPRLDSTAGGSGTQRVADYTTWTWSDNPAICTATYMIMAISDGGEGIPAAEIDWAYVAAAANICDQTLTTPAGAQKRYRVTAALSTGDRRNDNRSKLLDAMFGVCVRVGTKYRIYAGAYANPTDTVDETWLAGGPSVVPKTELTQLYNAVRITYTDEKQGYRSLETAPFTNSAFETQDGGDRLFRSISYPTCPDAYQAQLLGAIAGNKSRRQMQVTLRLNWKGLNLDPWQTVSLSFAALPRLAGRTFRVTSWQWTSQGPIVGLSEDNAADYTIAAYTTVDGAVITTSTTYAPPERVTSIAALAVADGVQLSWVETNTASLRKQVYRSAAGVNIFGQIGTTTASYFKDAFTTGASYDYKVVVISDYGVVSPDSAIVNSSGKIVADGADVTARAGLVLLQNPSFEAGPSGWELQSGWSIVNDAANSRAGSYVAVFTGTSNAVVNLQRIPTEPGEQIMALCWIKSSAGATGTGRVRIDYYSSFSGGYVGSAEGNVIAAGTTYRQSRVVGTTPAGAAYARVDMAVYVGSGSWYADDFAASLLPRNQDDVPDGSLYQRGTTRRGFDLIQNGDFELSSTGVPPGWAFGTTGLFSGEVGGAAPASYGYATGGGAYIGAQSLQVNTNGAYQSVCHRAVFRVTPGEVYSLRSAMKVAGIGSARMILRYYNASNAWMQGSGGPSDYEVSTTSTSWSLIGGNCTIPAGAVSAVVMFDCIANTAAGSFFVDAVTLKRISSLDDDVQDGTRYGRVGNPYLQGGGRPRIAGASQSLLSNPGFELNTIGATPASAAGAPLCDGWDFYQNDFSLWTATRESASVRSGSWSLYLSLRPPAGSTLSASGVWVSRIFSDVFPVAAGDTLTISGWFNATANAAVPAGVLRQVRIGVFLTDAAGNYVAELYPTDSTNYLSSTFALLTVTGAIPANVAYGRVELVSFITNTSGSAWTPTAGNLYHDVRFDDVQCVRVSILDTDVSDGPVYGRVRGNALTSGNPDMSRSGILNRNLDNISDTSNFSRVYTSRVNVGRPFIDFAEGIHSNKNLDNLADTANYSRVFTGRVNAGRPTIDFFEGIHSNKNLDWISDTGSYARVAANHVISGVPALSVAGSGIRLGDQRNAPPILIANARSKWSGLSITSSYSSASPAVVTISASAATLQMGNASVSYAAMSAQVSQARGATVPYFLYCDDTTFAGGGRTLVITTSGDSLYQADGRIYVGSITITVPASGAGTGPGGDGGGGACVADVAFEPGGRQFAELVVADRLQLSNEHLADLGDGEIEQIGISQQVCVTVITANGAQLTCSLDAPIATPDGFTYAADLALDQPIATLVDGEASWSPVESVEPRGVRAVRPLYVGNRSFWAGDHARACILHHNAKVTP